MMAMMRTGLQQAHAARLFGSHPNWLCAISSMFPTQVCPHCGRESSWARTATRPAAKKGSDLIIVDGIVRVGWRRGRMRCGCGCMDRRRVWEGRRACCLCARDAPAFEACSADLRHKEGNLQSPPAPTGGAAPTGVIASLARCKPAFARTASPAPDRASPIGRRGGIVPGELAKLGLSL